MLSVLNGAQLAGILSAHHNIVLIRITHAIDISIDVQTFVNWIRHLMKTATEFQFDYIDIFVTQYCAIFQCQLINERIE